MFIVAGRLEGTKDTKEKAQFCTTLSSPPRESPPPPPLLPLPHHHHHSQAERWVVKLRSHPDLSGRPVVLVSNKADLDQRLHVVR